MKALWQDVRYGLRMLAKTPGFTAVAVVSLALGIGAGTAIFSLVNAILLYSLPVPNPHELRVLKWSGTDSRIQNFTGGMTTDAAGHATGNAFSYPLFCSLRQECRDLADVFGYLPLYSVTVRAKREAFIAEGSMVSDGFFSVLGLRAQIGRLLSAEDEQDEAPPTMVISHALWEREFSLDPAALGQAILVNGHSFTVIGVLPSEFAGLCPADQTAFYVSMAAQPQLAATWSKTVSDVWWVQVMARLKSDTRDAQFQAATDVVFAREAASTMKSPKILLEEGRAGPSQDHKYYRRPLLLLLGVVGMVLLVACANLAGLSLARGTARQHEFSVRAAIGAGRWLLLRQMLTESLLLASLGGGLGVLLALWGKTAISRLLAGSLEGLHYDTSLDLRVLGFALAMVLVTALLSGLLPALRAAWVDPAGELKDRVTRGAPRLRLGRLLVVGQIVLSTLLLAGAGLYIRTLVNLVRINPGFATKNLLLFQVIPSQAGYEGSQRTAFYDRVQQALSGIPGVRSATLTQLKLLAGAMSGGGFFSFPGRTVEGQAKPQAYRLAVSETFFATMGIPVLAGRDFRASDVDGGPKVAVVNETFARKYLPNENPLGQVMKADGADWQIVGVCADTKYSDIKEDVPPTVYFSFRQDSVRGAYFALRTSLPSMAVATAVRKTVATIDPDVPVADVTTQEQVRDERISQERLFAVLCSVLSLLAVFLSCIGLYGLMAYGVARRTGEIGVRMALGARPRDVAGPILRDALLLAVIGVAVGLPAVFVAGRLIRSQLYGVAPYDPVALVGTTGVLVAVAVVAAWLPARRAARIDPMVALRYE
ncbi:MAG: ABC transporter permease [Phycisphaerales bacterium]